VWAAKYVARHPNLVAIDLSSFKCGHDAPIYNTIERVIESSNTPYFTFHDIDENKPSGSIKIRVETIDYFLQRYQEHLQRQQHAEGELQQMVAAYKARLQKLNARAMEQADPSATLRADLAAGHVQISGNDSRANRRRQHPLDEAGRPHHGSDVWQPVSLKLIDSETGSPALSHTSNGNSHSRGARPCARTDLDSSAYDRIRARNTADDPVQEDFSSGSISCSLPGQDYPKKAYSQIRQAPGALGEVEEDGHIHRGNGTHDQQLVQLVNLRLPRAKREEKETVGVGDD
jgi:hypothetical protein